MNRLLLLLAGSNLSDREISKLLRELSMMSEAELFSAITDLRHQNTRARSYRVYTSDFFEDEKQAKNDSLVIEQVSQMLRGDTGLTTIQASHMLAEALRKHLPSSSYGELPALNKESFATWIRKVALVVPPSILLHEAAKIRNRLAHSSESDWPLGKK
jgi:hypothetical protein